MYLNNTFLYRKLKKLSWDYREEWLKVNPKQKLISTYRINRAIAKPTDWLAIAQRCSMNNSHEHFGKEPEDILSIWQTKKTNSSDTGNTLDDYITQKLARVGVTTEGLSGDLLIKAKQFDGLFDRFLSKLPTYVGSEIWLTSPSLGLSVRLDSLFTTTKGSDTSILICEWKNTEKISTENIFERLLGSASHLEKCDLVEYTIQVHIYRYILEEYGLFGNVHAVIYQFSTENEGAKLYKPAFDYDPKFIEDIVKQSKIVIENEKE